MLPKGQKHADSNLFRGSYKSNNADGVKRTLVTYTMTLNVATYPQASSYDA